MWVAIVAIVAAGGWYFWKQSQMSVATTPVAQTTSETTQKPQNTASASSDSNLSADLNSIDTQLQAASAESSSAGSFSDKPVAQTQ